MYALEMEHPQAARPREDIHRFEPRLHLGRPAEFDGAGRFQDQPPVRPPTPLDYRGGRQQENNAFAGGQWIHKWALWFDGGPQSLDAEDFIFRVERQAQLHGVSERALVIGVGSLLRDRAAQWYWTFQRQHDGATWIEFKRAFIDRYAPCRESDYEIRSRIEARKQRSTERFNDFCQDVEALAVRLVRRMPEEELVEVLRRNMHMTLKKALWQVGARTVGELLRRCNEYERLCSEDQQRKQMKVCELESDSRAQPDQQERWREEQQRYEQQLRQYELELQQYEQQMQRLHLQQPGAVEAQPRCNGAAGAGKRWWPAESAGRSGHGEVYYVEAIQNSKPVGKRMEPMVCWNCQSPGHMFAQCSQQQRSVFCFTCGLQGHISITCPRCTLNARRGKPAVAVACPSIPALPQPPNRMAQTQMPQRTKPTQRPAKATANDNQFRSSSAHQTQ